MKNRGRLAYRTNNKKAPNGKILPKPLEVQYFTYRMQDSSSPYPCKYLCIPCRKQFKRSEDAGNICPDCSSEMRKISPQIRVPKKNASNKVWQKFLKRFIGSKQ